MVVSPGSRNMSSTGFAVAATARGCVWLSAAFCQHHAVALQREDLVLAVAMLRQHIVAVLREPRWRATGAAGRAPHFNWRADAAVPVELGDHLTMSGMGRRRRFIDRQHRTCGNAVPDQL